MNKDPASPQGCNQLHNLSLHIELLSLIGLKNSGEQGAHCRVLLEKWFASKESLLLPEGKVSTLASYLPPSSNFAATFPTIPGDKLTEPGAGKWRQVSKSQKII